MTAQKDRITRDLLKIGACWAVTADKCILPSDGFYAWPTYHVHPDASEPHQNYVQRFTSLKELEAWIAEHRPSGRRPEAKHDGKRINVYLAATDKVKLRRRHGSVQAAIERLVRDELDES